MEKDKRLIIEADKIEANYWRDIWNYRELFYILSWRDIKVRYKQTIVGVLWSFIRPFLTMIIFTIIFNKVAGLKSSTDIPYALVVFCGLLPWNFFSTAFVNASDSLISNSNLLTKVYFPRIIVPVSAIITSFIDFLISLIILFGLMVYYKFIPSSNIFYLPLFVIFAIFQSLAFGILLASLNVQFRDFRYIIPFIVQIGLYISPIGFTSDVVSEEWKFLFYINPIVSLIDGFRWSILGGNNSFYVLGKYFLLSFSTTFIYFFISIYVFRKMEKKFADII
jgi:lipopolysaccharide transport system permease protein